MANDGVNLNEYDFKVAFSVENINDDIETPIDDPDFVEWTVFFKSKE